MGIAKNADNIDELEAASTPVEYQQIAAPKLQRKEGI